MNALWILLMAALASAQTLPKLSCQAGLFRFAAKGNLVSEAANFCFDQNHGYLVSKNCEDGNCVAQKKDVCAPNLRADASTFGTPGAKLCEKMGGAIQRGAYFDGKDWWDGDRCLFAEDKSFVDSGTLTGRQGDCPASAPETH